MRIDLRNLRRERLFTVDVDPQAAPAVVRPPSGDGPEVYLNWDRTIDDKGYLRQCPVCSCRELFVRKDFPQVTGFVIVVLAAAASMFLFYMERVLLAVVVLAAVALVDLMIYFFTGRCMVCYRCRSEFRRLPIHPDAQGWELATGEKYRLPPAEAPTGESAVAPAAGERDKG